MTHLLTLSVLEPRPGHVLPEMAAAVGPEEAARRYRAIVVTSLRQLQGLEATRLRLRVEPEDGDEAVRFWLLPRLADRWQMEGALFRAEGWEIDFGGEDEGFATRARAEVLSPDLGARWVHTARLGLGRSVARVLGPAIGGGLYFEATTDGGEGEGERELPPLPVISNDDDWQLALSRPIGRALKNAWKQELP